MGLQRMDNWVTADSVLLQILLVYYYDDPSRVDCKGALISSSQRYTTAMPIPSTGLLGNWV